MKASTWIASALLAVWIASAFFDVIASYISYEKFNKQEVTCAPYEDDDYKIKAIMDLKKHRSNFAALPSQERFLNSLESYTKPVGNITEGKNFKNWSVYQVDKTPKYRVSFVQEFGSKSEYYVGCTVMCGELVTDCEVMSP